MIFMAMYGIIVMVLFGKKLTRMFHKIHSGAKRMFHKVRGGLSKALSLIDNPVVAGIADKIGLGNLHQSFVKGIGKAHQIVDRAENVAHKVHGLAHSVTADAERALTGAKGLVGDHTETAMGKFTHDLAHMKHDALQRAKDIANEAKGGEPHISYH